MQQEELEQSEKKLSQFKPNSVIVSQPSKTILPKGKPPRPMSGIRANQGVQKMNKILRNEADDILDEEENKTLMTEHVG